MAATAHAVQPPVHAPAPPVQRHAEPLEDAEERPQRLHTSLASVPAVQRQAPAGVPEDDDEHTTVAPRLEVGPVEDPYEREADDIAGQIMAMREPAVQRVADADGEDPDGGDLIHRRESTAAVQPIPEPDDDDPGDRVQARQASAGGPSSVPSAHRAPDGVQRKCRACQSEDTPVMPSLEVGAVDDGYEREADEVAARVMAVRHPRPARTGLDMVSAIASTPAPSRLQRTCATCSAEDEAQTPGHPLATTVQREPAALLDDDPLLDTDDAPRMTPGAASTGTEHIAATATELTSGGSALPVPTREFFESRMGRDLSGVRIHAGQAASALSGSIRARAFTYKNHVWLGPEEGASPSFTLAHELAHVVQQTAPAHLDGDTGREDAGAQASSASGPLVQRRDTPFWLPEKTLSASKLHKTMHDRAIEAIGKAHSEILSEVPIPGADRKRVDVGAKGRADLYTAAANPDVTVPGVKQVDAAAATVSDAEDSGEETTSPAPTSAGTTSAASVSDLGNFSPTMIEPMKQGSTVIPHPGRRAPKVAAGKLDNMSLAPTKIRIGEMKPAHDISYRNSGAKQVENYIAGITAVADKVNSVPKGDRQDQKWTPDAKAIDGTSLIPGGWDASRSHTDWPLPEIKIRHYEPTRAKTKSGRRKVKAKDARQGRPKSQSIRGRWMMAADNEPGHDGVFVYFLAPNPSDLATALGATSTRTRFRGLSTKLEKIKNDLIAPPKPVTGSGAKVQRRRLSAEGRLASVSRAPARVARKGVKDDFKAVEWERARTGGGLEKGAKDDSLLADFADVADDDLREEISEKGAMAEWLKTKPATPGISYTEKTEYDTLRTDLKLLKGVDFWTGLKAKPFGMLREKFGLFFVKAYQKAADFGQKVREKFKSFKEGRILAGKKGTIVKAAAKVASVVLPRLVKPFMARMFDTIVQCGITGFEAKFKELIEGTFIDDVIQTAEEMKGKVENLAGDAEEYFKDLISNTVDPIAKDFEKFVDEAKLVMDVVSMVKEITQAIRIGSCVAGLALAPETVGIGAVVGCGAALGDYILSKFGLSPVDHLIGTILSSCDMQNRLGKLMAGIGFIKSLPRRAGKAVITEVKSLLAGSEALKNLGSFKNKHFGQHASELFCNPDTLQFPEMGYEETDCSDTGSYRQSKSGSYVIPEDIALYTKQKTTPDAEKPWMGVEVPAGREGEVVPMPADSSTDGASESGQAADGGDGAAGEAGRKAGLVVKPGEPSGGPTPPEFRGLFIHGIESGFNTDASGGFDEATAGGCYAKNVKISVHDIHGFHEDERVVPIKVCKIKKMKNPPYPDTPTRALFEPEISVLMNVVDSDGNLIASYGMFAGKRYGAWLAQRKPD